MSDVYKYIYIIYVYIIYIYIICVYIYSAMYEDNKTRW